MNNNKINNLLPVEETQSTDEETDTTGLEIKPLETHEEKSITKYWRDKSGALWLNSGKEPILISKTYIKVISQLMALDNTNWTTKVEFDDMKGRRRTVNIPNAVLLEQRETLKILADAGFNKSDCKTPVAKYLRDESSNQYIIQIKQSGWIKEEYICPSFQINNPQDKNTYEFISSNDYSYEQKGILEEWKENVGKYAEGNPVSILELCASLTGSVLKFFPSIGSNMVHLTGRSSSGKSAALKVTGSVWGSRDFIQQWRTTSNPLEGIAEAHNDGCLILDELGQAGDKDFDNGAYMLGNERGKGRMTANAELKKIKKWRLCALSSGEVGIADKIEAGGKKARAGQLVRCIDIDAIVDEKNGIYNELHGFSDGAALSNHLMEQTSKYYGTEAEAWVKHIACESGFEEIIKVTHERAKKTITERFNLQDADGQVKRVIDIFALLAAVGIEASVDNVGIFTFTAEQVEDAVHTMFERWLKDIGGAKSHDEREVIEHIVSFLGQHDSRFRTANEGRVVHNCLSYKLYNNQESRIVYRIYPGSFKTELCKDMIQKTVRKVLKDKGWLRTYDDNRDLYFDTNDGRKRMVTLYIPVTGDAMD